MKHEMSDLNAAERGYRDYRQNAAYLAQHGMYAPSDERDNCGVGFVAAIDGKPRREVVVAAIGLASGCR